MTLLDEAEPQESLAPPPSRESAALLADAATVLSNVPDAIVVTDLAGRITLFSKGAAALFGYSEDEVLGRASALLYEDGDEGATRRGLTDGLGSEERTGERQSRTKDGRRLSLEVRTSPVRDAEGHVIGLVRVSQDITAKKAKEEAAHEHRRLLEHTLQVLAHDLRNPLNSLGMSLSLLEPTVAEQGGKSYLAVASRAGERMRRTLTDLGDVVALARGDVASKAHELRPERPLERARAYAERLALERGVLLTSQIPADLPELRGDDERIEQALVQLAHAAILRSAPRQGVTLRVRLREDDVVYEVEDQGEAPPPRVERPLETLEGPFRGLGMALAKGLAEAMGGRLFVEDTSPGARFCLALPRAR